ETYVRKIPYSDTVIICAIRPHEKKRLVRMKRQRSNAVNSLHARVLLLSRGRVSNRDIAAHVGYSPQWVRTIIHRFNDDGIDGVLWYPYWQVRGTPRKFLADVREHIAEVALSSPK